MKRFAPLLIAAVAMGSLAGCAADTGSAKEMTAEDSAAVCANPEGTNAAIATLATAMAQELHRWQILTDFYEYRGYQNQLMLGLTQAGLNACGGSCPITQNILQMQDARMDQKIVFNGTLLSSWSFASRLTTGYDNQKSCTNNHNCPFAAHTMGYNYTTAPGSCDTVFTFPVMKPASQGGGNLSASDISGLANALIWTTGNGPNPYIAFQPSASTVSVDPTGQLNPPGQQTGTEICQMRSTTNINYSPCTCAARNIYSNGGLRNDDPNMPNTYFCRQQ
jgi:hypothetical protein